MSTVQPAATSGSTAPSRTGQTFFMGLRIIHARRVVLTSGSFWLTLVKEPNPDDFHTGGTMEFRSSQRLGAVGDDFSGWVKCTGYPRQFQMNDKETGELVNVRTADNRFVVIEA